MADECDGFYAVYLTGREGQSLALLVFQDGKITGADVAGVKFDGEFRSASDHLGYRITLNVHVPANLHLIQGGSSGPNGDNHTLCVDLPCDFEQQPFVPLASKTELVNARFVKLRSLNE